MSSIPVRKGTTVSNRRTVVRKNNDETKTDKDSDVKKKDSPTENRTHVKQLTHQNSKQELLDENSRLKVDVEVQGKQIEELKSILRATQDQLHQSTEDNAKVKDDCERVLLTCNINPVTLEKMTADPEEHELKRRRDKTKEHIAGLHKNLQNFNTQGADLFKNVKDVLSGLDDLDSTVGQLPNNSSSMNV